MFTTLSIHSVIHLPILKLVVWFSICPPKPYAFVSSALKSMVLPLNIIVAGL